MRLDGAIAIISGASRGVGRATALRLAAEGAKVVAVARDAGALDLVRNTAQERGLPGSIVGLVADVRDAAAIRALSASVIGEHGGVDVLVNNAGAERVKPLPDVSDADYDLTVDTNLRGVFHMTRAFLPGMLARRRGHIVSMASMAGIRGFAEDAIYCASKFGVVGFMESLDEEVRSRGIKVTTICPGAIETELLTWLAPDDPSRKHLLLPDDVADAILYALRQPARAVIDRIILRPMNEPPYSPMIDAATMDGLMEAWRPRD